MRSGLAKAALGALISLVIGSRALCAETTPVAAASSAPAAAVAAPAAKPVAPPPAAAVPAPVDPATALADAQETLTQLQNQAPTVSNDSRLAAMEGQAAAVEAKAQSIVSIRSAALASVNQSLSKLPPKGRHPRPMTDAERAKAAPLMAQGAALTAQLRQAQAVATSASATYNLIAERRRQGFSGRLLEQSASPLAPSFWTGLAAAAGTDFARLAFLVREEVGIVWSAPEPRGVGGLLIGVILALALVFPVRWGLEKLGRRKSGESVHPGFARTGAALWIVAVGMGTPMLAAISLRTGAQWGGLLSDEADSMASAFVVAVTWASAILALGRVLATDREPNHRLLAMSEDTSKRLRAPLLAVAVVTASGLLLNRANFLIGASVSATIAANCVVALAYVAVAGLILASFGRGRPEPEEGEGEGRPEPAAARSPAWTLASLLLGAAILITVGAILAGYTTLAALTSSQIFWLSMIAAAAYLLLRFVDDLCGALFGPHGAAARVLFAVFSLRRSTISQAGLLVAAGLELLIAVGALSLALTPFGQGGSALFTHLNQLGQGIKIGSATLSPSAIAAGLATLAVGMMIVRVVRGWIVRRYLPVTDWDAGVRNSVSTGVGYLGAIVALLCALAAMGLGFQQIALIASALSVGIGFGLQQVVQNFVSGVILLIERPVKVGDWIKVDGVEGDVRRIRVRATEIQAFDRSTVIVPNSDLITKQVTNKMLGESRARIKLELSIANPAQAAKAAKLIADTAAARPKVLKEPPPVVYIDSVADGGAVNFVAYVYVASPRDVTRTRSEIYFDVLEAFQTNEVPFKGTAGPAHVVIDPGEDLRSMMKPNGHVAEAGAQEAGGGAVPAAI
jgi:potassium efflux system protein